MFLRLKKALRFSHLALRLGIFRTTKHAQRQCDTYLSVPRNMAFLNPKDA